MDRDILVSKVIIKLSNNYKLNNLILSNSNFIDKIKETQNWFQNCRMFVQHVTGESNIESLPKVKVPRKGDILWWGTEKGYLHVALYISKNEIWQVDQWGAKPEKITIDKIKKDFGPIERIYRPKNFNKEYVDAGIKDWLLSDVLSFSTLFGNVSKAMATPQDLDNYLSSQKSKIEKNVKLKGQASIDKNFKNLGNGQGIGSFKIKAGPFTIVGEYSSIASSFKKFKIDYYVDNKASVEEIEAWEKPVEDFVSKMEKEYNK